MLEKIERSVRRTLPRVFIKKLPRRIKVIAVSERESRRLNRIYGKKNFPANVLSFRYGSDYGEVIVCQALILREAKAAGHSYQYQMTWMLLHGMIHLAGIHHENSAAVAKRFERIEKSILKRIKNQEL